MAHNLNITVPGVVGYPPQAWGSGPGEWSGDASQNWGINLRNPNLRPPTIFDQSHYHQKHRK